MEEKRIVLGYDLNMEFAQISYLVLDKEKPETYAFREEGEKYNIPLYLCKRKGFNQWYYGDEALACYKAGEGILVEDVFGKALRGEQIVVTENYQEQSYDPVQLLGLFIKKSFSKMGFFLGSYEIQALMFTVDELSERCLQVLSKAVESLHLDREQIYFQSHIESIYHYIIHQPKELWSYQVGVFDFIGNKLKSYRVEMNHKTKPIVTLIHPMVHEQIERKKDFPSIMEKDRYYEQLDIDLYRLLNKYVEGNIMTSIYLIGDGFSGDWYKQSLQFLCKGRRVFGGNNLYSKGACLAAGERIRPGENASQYVFLGKEKLKYNVGIKLLNGKDEEYEPILDAGVNWYEAKAELDFMLIEGNTIPIIITPMMGEVEEVYEFLVDGFENRPKGTVRLQLSAWMNSETEMVIRIKDEGFGDFFCTQGKVWEEKIVLGV